MTQPLPSAKPEEVGLSQAALDRLSTALNDRIASGHIPGAVALVARHGKVAFHQSFGRLSPAQDTPMTTDAIFRIYSMTKAIVSVAVMMLWEEGRLLLGDPISKYIPAFAETQVGVVSGDSYTLTAAKTPITVQDLLRHTSGLTYEFRGNGPIHKEYAKARISRLKQSNADQANELAKLPLLHQPGSVWEYSRSTDVLGRLVEVISGQTLGAFLSERVLLPLGMTHFQFRQRIMLGSPNRSARTPRAAPTSPCWTFAGRRCSNRAAAAWLGRRWTMPASWPCCWAMDAWAVRACWDARRSS